MGRKKNSGSGKSKGGAPGGSSGNSPRDTEPETVQSSEPSQTLQVEVEGDLATQLAAAKSEIAALKAALAKKDEEIAKLRTSSGATSAAPAADTTEEMSKLHDRLASLRKEQADADAAKDAAWKQLKSIVSEISKLALPAAGTPTAA